MRVAVVCPRGRVTKHRVLRAIKNSGFYFTEVVTWPRRFLVLELKGYFNRHNRKVKAFPTKWSTFGRDAPLERDKKIVGYCDAFIAIYDGDAPDVRNFLAMAIASGKAVHVEMIG